MLFDIRAKITIKKKKWTPGKPFNPNFDGNLIAWYDGDTLATDPAGTWQDQSTNNYDLTLFNNPTIVSPAINGHDALQFDGINQYARRNLDPVLNQPTTYYFVFKQIVWALNNHLLVTGIVNTNKFYQNFIGSPGLDMNSGANLTLNPQLNLNNYGLVTCVFNGLNSELRNNNNLSVIGNAGATNGQGLTIGAYFTPSNYTNCEFAYLIIRAAADNTVTQNYFINFLKTRFAL